MSQQSDGVFRGMVFETEYFGKLALDALKEFAPPGTHDRLQAQLSRLVEIHDSGRMPILGTVGQYEWLLAVWSWPSPTRICLLVWRTDRQHMSIAEVLEIEKKAKSKAHPTAQGCVNIRPREIPDSRLEEKIWANIRNKRHWSHGLI